MLRVAELAYRYPSGQQALSGIAFDLQAGEAVTVLGPNGSGKSTLLRVLARVLDAGSGSIELDGKAQAQWPRRDYARVVGYLAQEPELVVPMRAIDVVESGRAPFLGRFEWEGEQDRSRAQEALARCDAAHLASRYVTEMSGGERKRIFLARVLTGDPRLLILDEPFSAVDLAHVQQMTAVLRRVVRGGAAALVASHDVNWAASTSDRVIVMHGGTIAAVGRPEEVITEALMRSVFGIEAEIMRRRDGTISVLPVMNRQDD
jgi:iron complex transport system ATP-binding protein